jgi:hypothetical protein
LEQAFRSKGEELAALKAELADAEAADAEAAGRSSRSGGSAPKPTALAIAKKIEKAEGDVAATQAAVAQAHDDLSEAMALDAEYAAKRVRDGIESATVEAVAEVQRAQQALARLQREYDTNLYVAALGRGEMPREAKAGSPRTAIHGVNGEPYTATQLLDEVADTIRRVASS